MGCLLELFFEIFLEGLFELTFYAYLKLTHLIVPEKHITETAKQVIKKTITAVSCLLIVVIIVGLCFLADGHGPLNVVGRYLTFVPLGIIALEIVLGIVFKLVSRTKK